MLDPPVRAGVFSLPARSSCAAAPSTMICSMVASAAATPAIGSCARPSSDRRSRRSRPSRRSRRRAADGAAAAGRLPDHRAGACDLRRGPAARAAIGDQHPRHAPRSKGRHLRPDGCAVAPTLRPRLLGRSADRSRCADPEGAGLRRARSSRPRSGAASSAKRSTTTIGPSPIPAPTAIWRLSGRHRSFARIADPRPYERAGLYGAYGDVHVDVNGLVTNPAATAYVLSRTGR